MANEEKYLLIDEQVVPDIFKKVLEAKRQIATGKAKNASEAVKLADISRSAFYKYKDHVMEYNPRISNNIITLYMTMEDIPGVLSSVINHLAEYGANILTINQSIPTNGCAGVTVSAETSDMTETMDEMFSHLAAAEGVLRFEIMAG